MKENKSKVIMVLVFTAVIAVGAAVATCIFLVPRLRLGIRLGEVLCSTYTYSAKASVEGMDFGIFGEKLEGELVGSKGGEVIYGDISSNGFEYLEVYVDSSGEAVFNIEKLFESMLAKAEERTGISLDFIKGRLSDLTISLSQIEEITGRRLVTMSEAGVTYGSLERFTKAAKLLSEVKPLKKGELDASYQLIGEEAQYFLLSLNDGNTRVYVGVPKDRADKRTALVAEYTGEGKAQDAEAVVWKLALNYELGDVKDMEVPGETLSEDAIGILKKIYGYLE